MKHVVVSIYMQLIHFMLLLSVEGENIFESLVQEAPNYFVKYPLSKTHNVLSFCIPSVFLAKHVKTLTKRGNQQQ